MRATGTVDGTLDGIELALNTALERVRRHGPSR
jgi:hypothetical protein